MSIILGHRGYSARHLENSMEAFRAALASGMDGFELDVQPTRDRECVVMHDENLGRTAQAPGILRQLEYADLPLLKNGEPIPRLADVLQLSARLINVELKGSTGWQVALETVQSAGALDRVVFSSFQHSEVWQIRSAAPLARCGLLWTVQQALRLSTRELGDIPPDLSLHPHVVAVRARPELWRRYADRLIVWGMKRAGGGRAFAYEPAVLIADAP